MICGICGMRQGEHRSSDEACQQYSWEVGDPIEERWSGNYFAPAWQPGQGAERVLAEQDRLVQQSWQEQAEVRSVSSTGGEKGTKIFRYDLIPAWPLRMLAKLYGVGARKYAERNWEKGYEWSKSFAALNRHLWAWWGGEDTDEETGIPHLICVAWHAFALAEFANEHPEFDDRPTGFHT